MNSITRYARHQWSRNLRLGSTRRRLTAEQVALARQLWAEGLYRDEIARRLGVGVDVLIARRRDQLAGLPKRTRGPRRACTPTVDPTPAEIEERAAAIRETWSDEEREERRLGRTSLVRLVRLRPTSRAGSFRWRRGFKGSGERP
jgi:hypothetical protein